MIILKNDNLEAHINPKGAEIIQLIGLKDGMNYMWKRDPDYWASSAPILFPIVGRLVNNQYKVDNQIYHLNSHGFARHHEFSIKSLTKTKVILQLDCENFLNVYPFCFELNVTYCLEDNKLACYLKVKNIDNKPIYFGIGGHPAFSCPFYPFESSNDYYIEFQENESINRMTIDVKNGLFTHKTLPLLHNEKRFFITQNLFDDDAIIVNHFRSKWVAIKSINHLKSIKLYMHNFNYLGIWASKKVGQLIALEPWRSHGDYDDASGELKDKEDIVRLDVHEVFEGHFKIEINQ